MTDPPRATVITRRQMRLVVLGALAVAAALVWLVVSIGRPEPFAFRDLAHAPGFRELVAKTTVSGADPLIGLGTGTRSGVAPPKEGAAICRALFRDPGTPAAGGGGALPVAEFFDYRCPYCRTLSEHLTRLARGGRVRVFYKEWPILGDGSALAARAALAAVRQGKYTAIHARLMAARLLPTDAYIAGVAAELGLDPARLRADMRSDAVTAQLRRTAALARALRLPGTPALVVGRTLVRGAISPARLEALIDLETAGGQGVGC